MDTYNTDFKLSFIYEAKSYIFWYIVVYYYLFNNIFKFFVTSNLTPELMRNMCLNSKYLGECLNIMLFNCINIITGIQFCCVRESTFLMTSLFWNVLVFISCSSVWFNFVTLLSPLKDNVCFIVLGESVVL